MRILLTGTIGFAGGHLAEALAQRGDSELFGLSRRMGWPEPLRHLANQVQLRVCDLTDRPRLETLLVEIQPERIYHLGGYASAGASFREVEAAWEGNLRATLCLYDAVQGWGGRPRILYVSSGLVYGDRQPNEPPPDERCPLCPVSPYAASKAAADLASFQYTCSAGLDIVRARPFNHIGPRQSAQYAVANFARQIAAIEKGRQEPILETGNLSPVRDLTDVRDMVQAYILLMEHGRTGEVYNVASGQVYAMQTVLNSLLTLSQKPIGVRQQAKLVRARETVAVSGAADKVRQETGWTPALTLDQSLADTLDFWRQTS